MGAEENAEVRHSARRRAEGGGRRRRKGALTLAEARAGYVPVTSCRLSGRGTLYFSMFVHRKLYSHNVWFGESR